MKKPTKSIITSSLLAVAFGALSVGSTFALFTSQAETKIEVATGIVEVSASFSESAFKTYSAQEDINGTLIDENGNKYSSVETANHVFANSGTATYNTSTSVLSLERLTPGDRVALSLAASFGNTNVSIKFRYGIVVEQAKTELAKALDFTIQEGTSAAEPYHGLVSYYSDWIFVSNPAEATFGPLSFDISMPIKAGNHYQDLETSYLFTLQAVQGNAVTNGEKSYTELEEDVVSEPQTVVENEDTTITAQANAASFEVKVPTSQAITYGQGAEQTAIDVDDKLTIEVADLGITQETYSTNTSLNFDLKVKVNGEEANNFSQPLEVKINVGSGKIITGVQHNDVEVTNYQYNSTTGDLSFSSTSFSPFSLDYVNGTEVYNYAQLKDALKDETVRRIGIKAEINASAVLEVTRSVEIFGVGAQKTINSTANRILWIDTGNVEVSLSNIHFKGDGVNTQRGLQVNLDCIDVTLNISDVKVTGITYYGINVCANTTINLNLERCEVEAWGAVNIWSNGFTTTIKDSKLTGWNDKGYNADGWNGFGVVVCGGDTTHETEASSSDNTIRIINTELVAKSTTGNLQCFVLFNLENKNNTVILENAILTSYSENDSPIYVVANITGNSISGTYTLDGEPGVL